MTSVCLVSCEIPQVDASRRGTLAEAEVVWEREDPEMGCCEMFTWKESQEKGDLADRKPEWRKRRRTWMLPRAV